MSYETVYKSLTDGHETWQIIKKNGVYHWRGSLKRCYWCNKVEFDYEDVAWLYSEYLWMKYGLEMDVYCDEDCEIYHMTTGWGIW